MSWGSGLGPRDRVLVCVSDCVICLQGLGVGLGLWDVVVVGFCTVWVPKMSRRNSARVCPPPHRATANTSTHQFDRAQSFRSRTLTGPRPLDAPARPPAVPPRSPAGRAVPRCARHQPKEPRSRCASAVACNPVSPASVLLSLMADTPGTGAEWGRPLSPMCQAARRCGLWASARSAR